MKNIQFKNYFTKVENKYVFNMSLIFWHLFIALSALAIVVSLLVFLWSVIPPSKPEVEKQHYPEKPQYPSAIQVALNELQLEEAKEEELPVIASEHEQIVAPRPEKQVVEDTRGKHEYDSVFAILKNLVPPEKYNWNGSGYWNYPYGEIYWKKYKMEKYRQWIITTPGIEDKLKKAYDFSNANDYYKKRQIMEGIIAVLKNLSEEKRVDALVIFIEPVYISNDFTRNTSIVQRLADVANKMPQEENLQYLKWLTQFGKRNPNDGIPFVEWIAGIINQFDVTQRTKIIDALINSFSGYFGGNNLARQKEATSMFLSFISKIKPEYQTKALFQYYGLYVNKNYQRENEIARIDAEYEQTINQIEQQYNQQLTEADLKYQADENAKKEFRLKALMGIGGGIILIVLIATILVFLSIQRSVRKIEEKISVEHQSWCEQN